ncbi:MAG: hypothetical protein DSY34_05320 [Desulfurobacterium sp.]|nr:MAG: hypothetical protein DSY34_05320 [Desulfurobacterium sp.]
MTMAGIFYMILFMILNFSLLLYTVLLREFTDPLKDRIERCILSSNTIEKLATCIKETLKLIDFSLIDVGIYRNTGGFYTRLNSYFNVDTFSENIINPDFTKRIPRLPEVIYNTEIERLGRYYVTSLKSQDWALFIMSKRYLDLSSLKSSLKLALQKARTLNTLLDKEESLKRFSVAFTSKGFFEKLAFEEKSFSMFLGNAIKLVSRVPYVEVKGNGYTFRIGSSPLEPCEEFFVRGTGIGIKICGKKLSFKEKRKIGKFLDAISFVAMEEGILNNYLQLLIETVLSFEDYNEYYKNHSSMVKEVSLIVASDLRLPTKQLKTLEYAAILHDIGLVDVVSKLIFEGRRLTEQEKLKIRYHTIIGASIVAPINKIYPSISEIILQHHEFCDGSGYPEGLVCEEILLESRVLALAEVFVGLVSDRPYRKAKTFDEAFSILTDEYSNKFSPEVIEAFSNNYEKIVQVVKSMKGK